KTRMRPSFSSTNQREPSTGSCSIATGRSNGSSGNTRSTATAAPLGAVNGGALHVELPGRASRPEAGCGSVPGPELPGGGPLLPAGDDDPPPQAAASATAEIESGVRCGPGTVRPYR